MRDPERQRPATAPSPDGAPAAADPTGPPASGGAAGPVVPGGSDGQAASGGTDGQAASGGTGDLAEPDGAAGPAAPGGSAGLRALAALADAALRLLAWPLVAALGAGAALVEVGWAPMHWHAVRIPLSLVAAVIGNPLLVWIAVTATGRRGAWVVPAVCWCLVWFPVSVYQRPEGDLLVLPNNWVGVSTTLAGPVAFGAAVYWMVTRSLRQAFLDAAGPGADPTPTAGRAGAPGGAGKGGAPAAAGGATAAAGGATAAAGGATAAAGGATGAPVPGGTAKIDATGPGAPAAGSAAPAGPAGAGAQVSGQQRKGKGGRQRPERAASRKR